jgi:hypothetical protein
VVSHRRVHSVYGGVRHVNKGRILRLCTEQNRQPIDPNGTNAGLTAVPHQDGRRGDRRRVVRAARDALAHTADQGEAARARTAASSRKAPTQSPPPPPAAGISNPAHVKPRASWP